MKITDIYRKKWIASYANVLVYLDYREYTFAMMCMCDKFRVPSIKQYEN